MILRRFFMAALVLAGVTVSAARIVDIENSPVPDGLSMDQVQQAIVSSSLERGWIASVEEPGLIEARLSVRSHLAIVSIAFDQSSYSITYKDSHNLDYKPGRIHRNYNRWVAGLDITLQRGLAAASTASLQPSRPAPATAAPVTSEPGEKGEYAGETVTVPPVVDFAIANPGYAAECRIGEELSELLRASSSKIEVGAVPSAGHWLDISITELHMPAGGAWSGPKWLEVTGTLREGSGAGVASFRAKRFSTGGAFAVFKGNCAIVQRCSKAIAQDIAGWLMHPIDGAELGDAR